ncbi:TraR/DksA C4-type zinc finger protein [Phosphitispora sp. TUW77]|uniref:TraR/DksA C4-type zinc finger protein n=1 Tax=Phosphitispora sp. TUW77 TaxID=3152361 RepID=UPI003AB3D600
MDRKLMEQYRIKLMQEKQEIEERITHMEEGAMELPVQDSISELSMYDNHPADLGTETFERSKDLALREAAQNHLAKIEDALTRIQERSYGKCDICGTEISLERLQAVPATTMCKKCKEAGEELSDRHPRPIEEDVIAPPFGGFTHDNSEFDLGDAEDEIMFDGEDAWQSVARFGTSETPQDISVHGVNDYNHMYVDADENIGTVESVEEIPYEKNLDEKGTQENFHL